MRRFLFVLVIILLCLGVNNSRAQTPKIQKEIENKLEKQRDDKKKRDTLESHITEALKNNPDIRVAESKVREAEAELNRTRLKVVSELTILHADIQAAHAIVADAEARFGRAKILFMQKTISAEEFEAAGQTLAKAKADLAARSAKLPYLLGQAAPGINTSRVIDDLIKKKWLELRNDGDISDEVFLRRIMLDVQGRLPTPEEMKKFLKMPDKERRHLWIDLIFVVDESPSFRSGQIDKARWMAMEGLRNLGTIVNLMEEGKSPLADKVRKALDTPIILKGENIPEKKILDIIREKMPGVNLHVRSVYHSLSEKEQKEIRQGNIPAPRKLEEVISVNFSEPIPLGAFLQYLEDEVPWVFVLREYGIVLVGANERLPPGAVRLTEFWKHGKSTGTKEKAKENAPEKAKSP